jgi:viroplasmin and RNaseH domain-containing protein
MFGINADLRKFKEEVEGFPENLYESCNSYAQAHKYLEEYLHQEKGNQEMEMTTIALATLKKNHVLVYEDLTKKQQDHARTLKKGIYAENNMIQMRILWSVTTISPTIQTDALSDIDINSPPAIRREPKNPRPKHI